MPELNHHLAHDAAALFATVSDLPVRSQLDEFVLGFRDCANESLRYLEATTASASDSETSGRSLVDALRVHLIEHEVQTMRRGRRRTSNNHHELRRSAATVARSEDLRSRPPPRCRRRLRVTPAAMYAHRVRRFHELHYPEETQTVRSQSRHDSDISDSSCKTTSNESGCGKDYGSDSSRDVDDDAAVAAAGDEFPRENTDELHQCANELSALAHRDLRVGRLLTELFQLMDNDDDQ